MHASRKKLLGASMGYGGLIIGGALLIHAVFFAPETQYFATLLPTSITTSTSTVATAIRHITGTPLEASASPSPFEPSRLLIPKLNVDAHVQITGLNNKGAIGTPTNFKDAAWFNGSTVPGAEGSAVIDGHVDNGLAMAGVFKHLRDLAPGDDVYVMRNDGKKLHFKVTAVNLYSEKDAPLEEIFTSSDDKAHLNLITCAGDWIQEDRTYGERLVVFTTLAS